MSDDTPSFVSLHSLKRPERSAQDILAEIRKIYFATTKKTIQHDFAHAVALLKTLPTEEDRERAAVFMEGLAQMRADWARADARKSRRGGRPKGP